MVAKRIAVILLGFAVGLGMTLGIMAIFSDRGMTNLGAPNIVLTSFCFGVAACIALDHVLSTGMIKR
jgi:hypothetical protein